MSNNFYNILIVEDFNNSRKIIRYALENKGYTILEAADGIDALQYFDGKKIDLVITDYNMPKMDGGTLVEKIRSLNQYRYIPILVLSTEINQEKKNRALQANITGWIEKPFNIEKFSKIVEKALR